MKWPKCLTYGNWGGAGWSSGKFTDDPRCVDWSVDGIDEMDRLFKIHDWHYQHYFNWGNADLQLVAGLLGCNVKGVWPNIYRIGAIGIFAIKGAACLIINK